MTPTPTGRIQQVANGVDLVLTRTIRGSIDDVWASITESERTARWFGSWEGDGRPGATVRLQLGFEEGQPWSSARIDACEPPTRLAVTTIDEAGSWHLEITLASADEATELTFVHHQIDPGSAGDVAAGWEYYLDNLVASREGLVLPDFNDYYPALKAHYSVTE